MNASMDEDAFPLSSIGINYTSLRDSLAAGEWKQADQETERIFWKVAGCSLPDYLLGKNIESFPCSDLYTIDRLWKRYSSGHFGFSVQKHIFESVPIIERLGKDYSSFGNIVGWRKASNWLYRYDDFTFSLNAPPGHLPVRFWHLQARLMWDGEDLTGGDEAPRSYGHWNGTVAHAVLPTIYSHLTLRFAKCETAMSSKLN